MKNCDFFVEAPSGGEKEETQDWHVFLILNIKLNLKLHDKILGTLSHKLDWQNSVYEM